MMSFRGGNLERFDLPPAGVWLLEELDAARSGMFPFSTGPSYPHRPWSDTARIQTVLSSNRIEGVTVEAARIEPLLVERVAPRNAEEAEVQGYQSALEWVWGGAADEPITPRLLLELHRRVLPASGDAGSVKVLDNEIVELRHGAAPRVRFRALSAAATPSAVAELSHLYADAIRKNTIQPLVTIAALILDLLCIHPFRDGNGRVSRLVTLLALDQQGHPVGRYASLDRQIEQSSGGYYDSLHRSSQGWHEGQHDLGPWLLFFLTTLRRTYRELEESRALVSAAPLTKTEQVESAIRAFDRDFTLQELQLTCPTVSRELIRKVLARLRREGEVEALGRGPGARWRKL